MSAHKRPPEWTATKRGRMAGTWVQHTPDGEEPHLLPIGDRIPHMPWPECICGPTLTGGEWVHQAADGRESWIS
jgi:hypothetical protein